MSDGFHLIDIDRVKVHGSDHFGISTTLTAARKDQAKPKASEEEEQEAEEVTEEGEEDAAEHDAGASEAG
ncbi:MAG: hypothetical protein ACTHZY_06365 [Halomonas sp.]|uniref:hypothetical protein n=1 Tax=unclassified Halomonas TaxID=2609666 RepID=UPI003CF4FB62